MGGAIGFTCAGGFGGKYLRVELFVPEVPEKDDEGKEVFFFLAASLCEWNCSCLTPLRRMARARRCVSSVKQGFGLLY